MGFVQLSDDLANWRWIDDKNTVYVYLRLLLKAAWSDRFQNGVEIKRGQAVISQNEFAKTCGISRQELRTILDRLVSTNKIRRTPTAKCSIITLIEYDCATNTLTGNQPSGNQQATNVQPTLNQPTLYNTNIQTSKQTNTAPAAREGGVLSEYFDKFWSAYPKKTAKQSALKAFLKLNPDEELLNKMLSSLEQQKKSVQWTKDNGQYIPYPATWLNGKRWEDELQQPVTKNAKNFGYDSMPKTEEEWLEGFRTTADDNRIASMPRTEEEWLEGFKLS